MLADHHSRHSQRDLQGSDPMAEHKRRARWRLMGAIILSGAVAAVAPFFLEEQARPLSEDLLVELPARPFSFALSDKDTTPAPLVAQAQAESSEDKSPSDSAKAKEEEASASNMPPVAEPVSPAPLASNNKAAPAPPTAKQLMVQVGAYATQEAADRVKSRLEAGGNKVVVQATTNAEGAARYRVRIGPFETREQAIEVRDRAKAQGYDAALVRS
jgi:DedD protein